MFATTIFDYFSFISRVFSTCYEVRRNTVGRCPARTQSNADCGAVAGHRVGRRAMPGPVRWPTSFRACDAASARTADRRFDIRGSSFPSMVQPEVLDYRSTRGLVVIVNRVHRNHVATQFSHQFPNYFRRRWIEQIPTLLNLVQSFNCHIIQPRATARPSL